MSFIRLVVCVILMVLIYKCAHAGQCGKKPTVFWARDIEAIYHKLVEMDRFVVPAPAPTSKIPFVPTLKLN